VLLAAAGVAQVAAELEAIELLLLKRMTLYRVQLIP
jgi:hypothetical protein